MLMQQEQIERLPPLFRSIVEHDREIEGVCVQPFVDLSQVREMFCRRRELAHHAQRQYSPGSLRGGSATA